VLETALRVIDREAPEAFTMRRVADELGVGVMTLYGYVRNKEEIVEGVTALALAEGLHQPPPDASWEDQVRADVEHLHDLCRRHPNLVTLVLGQTAASPGLFRLRERMLGTLLAAGFDGVTALHALGILTSYALGFGGLQASAAPIDLPERIRELPASRTPPTGMTHTSPTRPSSAGSDSSSAGCEQISKKVGLERVERVFEVGDDGRRSGCIRCGRLHAEGRP
jgi:AcrR family transcriptional regulator